MNSSQISSSVGIWCGWRSLSWFTYSWNSSSVIPAGTSISSLSYDSSMANPALWKQLAMVLQDTDFHALFSRCTASSRLRLLARSLAVTFESSISLMILRTTSLRYLLLRFFIMPWSHGCIIDVVFGGRNSRRTLLKRSAEFFGWAVQLSTNSRTFRFFRHISQLKSRIHSVKISPVIHEFLFALYVMGRLFPRKHLGS